MPACRHGLGYWAVESDPVPACRRHRMATATAVAWATARVGAENLAQLHCAARSALAVRPASRSPPPAFFSFCFNTRNLKFRFLTLTVRKHLSLAVHYDLFTVIHL